MTATELSAAEIAEAARCREVHPTHERCFHYLGHSGDHFVLAEDQETERRWPQAAALAAAYEAAALAAYNAAYNAAYDAAYDAAQAAYNAAYDDYKAAAAYAALEAADAAYEAASDASRALAAKEQA
jgi:hypothetical protein